jgi:cytochrome c biogenesis protein CcmG/thiol:disulfide interchange protein DsbE
MTTIVRPRRHLARWVALGVLVIGGALVAVLATRPSAAMNEVDTPLLDKPAPEISGTTLQGQHFDLATLRGRWVVLNFFASWCPPCQQEQPDLVTFAYQHRHAGDVALVGVVFDDAASSAAQFFSQTGATWPAVADPNGQIGLDYGVRGPPETFVIAPDGTVLEHLNGPVSSSGMDQVLAQLESAWH